MTFILGFTGCASCASEPPPPQPHEGVYVGIIPFAGDTEDTFSYAPVFLDFEGYREAMNSLPGGYTRSDASGTALYYAVHEALYQMSRYEHRLPVNLESANVVTFTDGLDNGSTGISLTPLEGQNFRGKQPEAYLSYVSSEIQNRKIKGKNITAFSAGVVGNDVEDPEQFVSNLQSLASAPENFYQIDDFSLLNQKFMEIADSLTIVSTDTTFVVATTQVPPGTKIRMTFDAADYAENSSRYLEGEVAYIEHGNQFSLTAKNDRIC